MINIQRRPTHMTARAVPGRKSSEEQHLFRCGPQYCKITLHSITSYHFII